MPSRHRNKQTERRKVMARAKADFARITATALRYKNGQPVARPCYACGAKVIPWDCAGCLGAPPITRACPDCHRHTKPEINP